MRPYSLASLYLFLSAVNGLVPLTIALLFSVEWLYALLVWGFATAGTYLLICLVCFRTAMKKAELASEDEFVRADLKKAPVYR